MTATTTRGASAPLAFPYKRTVPDGFCEVCHVASDTLAAVTVDPAREVVAQTNDGPRRRWRMRRVVWACPRHAGGNGRPVAPPRTTTLAGTSALRPQAERLFDVIPYDRRAGRFG